MAEESFPFQELIDGDRTVSAALFAKMLGSIRTGGVIKNIDNDLAVTESSPQAMSVDLDTGAAFVGLSELRSYRNTLARTLPIAAADPTNPRHDLLVLDMDTVTTPSDTRRVTALIVQGTPAASPVDPTLTVTEEHYQLVVARIVVGAAAASILDADIADLRAYSNPANSALTAGLTLVGSVTTEATSASATAVDLMTIPISPAIPADTPFIIVGNVRKTTGALVQASIGLKVNSTIVNEATPANGLWPSAYTSTADSAAFFAYFGPRVTNHLRAAARFLSAKQVSGLTMIDLQTADMPTADITSLVLRARSNNAAVTLGVTEVRVYTLAN